jgi:hypothetical protein
MIGTKVAELAVAGVLGVRFAGWDAIARGTHCSRIGGKQTAIDSINPAPIFKHAVDNVTE